MDDLPSHSPGCGLDDRDVVVDYGFKKHIALKVDPIEVLKPNQRVQLHYRVFDGEYDVTTTDAKNILIHFSDAPVKIHLQYENIEGSGFKAVIGPQDNQYITQEVNIMIG